MTILIILYCLLSMIHSQNSLQSPNDNAIIQTIFNNQIKIQTLQPKSTKIFSYQYINYSSPIIVINFQNNNQINQSEIKYQKNSSTQSIQGFTSINNLLVNLNSSSITFPLISKQQQSYQISITNKNQKQNLKYNITIIDIKVLNNTQKYSSTSNKNTPLYFKIESNKEQYLRFKINNCKNKIMTLFYHNDIALINTQENKEIINDYQNMFYTQTKSSVIFVKVQTEQNINFSIELSWNSSIQILKNNNFINSNRKLSYNINDNFMSVITFTPLDCIGCEYQNTKFEFVFGFNKTDAYQSSACQSINFPLSIRQSFQTQIAKVKKTIQGKLQFNTKIPRQYIFLILKAKLDNGSQFIYEILQISSFWGCIWYNPNYHFGMLLIIVITILYCCFKRQRTQKNKQYKELSSLQ